jgi:hypothetical protein
MTEKRIFQLVAIGSGRGIENILAEPDIPAADTEIFRCEAEKKNHASMPVGQSVKKFDGDPRTEITNSEQMAPGTAVIQSHAGIAHVLLNIDAVAIRVENIPE